MKNIEQNTQGQWNNYKRCNHTCNENVIRRNRIFETIIENVPKLMSDLKPHIQEAQRTPSTQILKNKK